MTLPYNVLLTAVVTGAGAAISWPPGAKNGRVFQAVGSTASGAGTASIDIEVSIDGQSWLPSPLGTITLVLATTPSNDGFASPVNWPFCRANITALTGTGAAVSVLASA